MQFQKPVLIQEQRQKLSPQMLQSIKLMALPVQDLVERIEEELEENPALEVIEDKSTLAQETFPEGEVEEDAYFEEASDPGFNKRDTSDGDSKRMFLEGAIARLETLQEHLIWQLRLQPIQQRQRELGELLIQNLDPDGFHKEDPYTLCGKGERDLLAKTIALIQSFEPVGTCCINYKESLVVQTRLDPEAHPLAERTITEYLELLEKGKHSEVARKLKINEEDETRLFAFIRKLYPFPGRLYSNEETRYVLPDLMVKPKEGSFVIILNDEEIPILGIDPLFMDISDKKKTSDKPTTEYVKRNIREARAFIQSIHQRNRTLLKVARAVVEFQRSFFMKGPKSLVPLTLKDIAQEIGVHETTVSRIANKKYIQTEWGIFELKYFFSNSISGAGSQGSRYSKEGVKQIIKEIIQAETNPLSDQDIANLLTRRGIPLARRTVAKYRNELKMSASFGR